MKVVVPMGFSQEGITDAVSKHVVVGSQISLSYAAFLFANKPTFTNCLVVMQLRTTCENLPIYDTIKVYIKNSFIMHIEVLHIDVKKYASGDIFSNWDM
ncbi:hypothetical protein OBBRIDRAFT_723288 [Obba rivulosa]|uniref:Uncharacterized protein n=1 Tax=Obba rivulosa TaxID=1052685 RepID=A0A8E2DR88_9APHY|nr:hypothetical protein OBBRIDRAFT_723288 [Obba rivulosa]